MIGLGQTLVFSGCVCGGVVCFVAVCRFVFAVHDRSVAILLSTHDI